jgi:hypothetical protein
VTQRSRFLKQIEIRFNQPAETCKTVVGLPSFFAVAADGMSLVHDTEFSPQSLVSACMLLHAKYLCFHEALALQFTAKRRVPGHLFYDDEVEVYTLQWCKGCNHLNHIPQTKISDSIALTSIKLRPRLGAAEVGGPALQRSFVIITTLVQAGRFFGHTRS